MKKLLSSLIALVVPVMMLAQGWPEKYDGVMLQGFYWDSFKDTQWTKLTSQADELSEFFDLIWVPQSGNCGGTSMGYNPKYIFTNYTSSFGNETALRNMINTFKAKGTGIIADVVINHFQESGKWVVFPKETYKGETMQFVSTDVVKNDDGGKTKTYCDANGYELSQYNDSGEGWDGMRDLDHNSANVQKICHAYLDKLMNDLGYTGVRYDMVKGYASKFTGLYNSTAKMQYSVGEYWDGNWSTVVNWINGTKVDNVIQSAAFDFPFRYTARDVVNNKDWSKLANASIARQRAYSRYAVTFIENHDTEQRSNAAQDPIKGDTLALNAFMLSMPGTPCVFLKHWQAYKEEIKNMIDVRKLVGVHNQSRPTTLASTKDYFVSQTATTKSGKKLVVMVGNVPQAVIDQHANGCTCVAKGYHYSMWVPNVMETAWCDKPTGEYNNNVSVTLQAVTATGKQLVYSTDGGATWTNAANGQILNFNKDTTLMVGLKDGSNVVGQITRKYTIKVVEPFDPYAVTVYVKDPTTAPYNWTSVYCWAWDDDKTLTNSKTWPGDPMTETKTVKGDKFYYRSFDITAKDYTFNFIFSQKGTPQTLDIMGIKSDIYLELGNLSGDKYQVVDVTEKYTKEDPQVKGDVNGDGTVDIADVNQIIDMILDLQSDTTVADVNGDGTVDVADMNAIINIILNL